MNSVIVLVVVVSIVMSLLNNAKKKQTQESARHVPTADQKAKYKMLKDKLSAAMENAQTGGQKIEAKAVPQAAPPMSAPGETHRGRDGSLHPTERVIRSRLSDIAIERPKRLSDTAQNGEDPCHAYMLDDPNLPACEDDQPFTASPWDEQPLNTQQELLRGIILSEILVRPARRYPLGRH